MRPTLPCNSTFMIDPRQVWQDFANAQSAIHDVEWCKSGVRVAGPASIGPAAEEETLNMVSHPIRDAKPKGPVHEATNHRFPCGFVRHQRRMDAGTGSPRRQRR